MTTQDRPALIQRLRWFADNTGDGELFVQAADMLEAADLTANVAQAVPTGKQSLQVAKHRTTGWMAPVDMYAVPVLFNPYSGEPRDVRDVASDPHGILIVPPGKVEMLAARQYPADMPNGDAQLKNGGLSLQPAVPQEPVKTKEQATAFIESKQEQSNGHGRHDEIRHDHHGDISLDSGAINSAAGKQDLSLTYTTGHCENHKQKGGCQLHNLQCGWPNCDRKPTGPTPIPQPAVPKEHDLHDAIMNIQANPNKTAGVNFQLAYKKGHRDARHAAAELAIAAPRPQRPRLTDDEIQELAMANVGVVHKLMCGQQITVREFRSGLNEFARLVERKVRCKA